jgi:hypothetical protein
MVRNGLEYDTAYLERAFNDLAGEEVSALVVYGPLRTNRDFIRRVAERFGMDPARPTFSYHVADVYVSRVYAKGIQIRLKNSRRYPDLTIPPDALADLPSKGLVQISPEVGANAFTNVTPAPYQVNFQFGLDWLERGSDVVLSAHPDSDLWLRPPAGATRIAWTFGIFEGAYTKADGRTNGVEFIVTGEVPGGPAREVYRRVLDPVNSAADRGDQTADIPYAARPGEVLRFSTRPNGNSAFDWAYTVRIAVR